MAAPTRSRPCESLAALGYFNFFWMSLTVIKPLRLYLSSTTSSFSTRCSCRIFSASSSVVPTGTVIRFFLVITLLIGISKRVSKRRSRLVRMPTSFPFSVIGTPEILYLRMTSSASETLRVGRHGHRIDDHAAFRALYFVDFVGLLLDRQVAMNDSHARPAAPAQSPCGIP